MTLEEGKKAIGHNVEVLMGVWGNYLGELMAVRSKICVVGDVRILACTKYPSQKAILFSDSVFERIPFSHNSIEPCLLDMVHEYEGPVPEYYSYMREVLPKTFEIKRKEDYKLYEKHCRYWGIQSKLG